MRRDTTRLWYLVHKWTSLVCTVFLLLLCLTGLPLIFYEEINHLTGAERELGAPPAGAAPASIDTLLERALAQYPGEVPLFFGWDDQAPAVYVNTGPRPDASLAEMHTVVMHAYSGEVLDVPQFNQGVMFFLYRLHTDLFAGLGGMLFLGAMGLLFVAAIVSGVVIYGPFMRKLDFGTLRMNRSRRLKWLDLHNLLGIVTLAWALVVGISGAVNTLADPLRQNWQAAQLGKLTDRYRHRPRSGQLASLEAAVATARAAAPGMTPAYVSYPGTGYSGEHHYGVFMHGETPLTERLYRAVLIDAATGELTATPVMPLGMQLLFLSQPLHFGDYGGLPLKIIWAILDLVTIVVLYSGLYLWIRRPIDSRRQESGRGAALGDGVAEGVG